VAAATRARELLGTTIGGVNEAVRQNFPAHVRDDVVIIPNGSDPGRVYPLVDRDELTASLGTTPEHKLVVYIGRIAVEQNVQSLIDADPVDAVSAVLFRRKAKKIILMLTRELAPRHSYHELRTRNRDTRTDDPALAGRRTGDTSLHCRGSQLVH
jgi:hypothetical protein